MAASKVLDKQKIIDNFKIHKGDTGSPEVQAALLTEKIKNVSDHLHAHLGDVHSRRGLLKMVIQRRRVLRFLNAKDSNRYKQIIAKLSLAK